MSTIKSIFAFINVITALFIYLYDDDDDKYGKINMLLIFAIILQL